MGAKVMHFSVIGRAAVVAAASLGAISASAMADFAAGEGTVKVRVPRSMTGTIAGQLVADYESFAVYSVDAKTVPVGDSVEVLTDENRILLNSGALDTTLPAVQALRKPRGVFNGKAMHMVQFAGPVKPEWYAAMAATGVDVVTYVASNAYIVYGDAASIGALQAMAAKDPSVQWDGEYLPEYRVDPGALKLANDPTVKTHLFAIQLIEDQAANKDTLAAIDALKSAPILNEYSILNYHNVIVELPPAALARIAMQPEVVSIQPWDMPTHACERQCQIISGNISGNSPSGPGYLAWLASQGFTQAQFTASNFTVDVSDSGLDNGTLNPNHFGLFTTGTFASGARVSYVRLEGTPHSGSTLQGCDGHGNLNAHIIAGYDNSSGSPFADSSGYHFGQGVCPFVKVGQSVIFDPSTFTSPNYPTLQSQAYASGARISSNSWGGSSNGYSVDSQAYDGLVRDAQSGTSGNQEMVIVFAAGNNGSAANTVGEPATAKNIITVGAAENVQAFGGTDGSGVPDSEANSINDMAGFSGRGPTADGRRKPDICAPGTHVSGGVAQASQVATGTGASIACFTGSGVSGGASPSHYFPNAGQQFYTASSGTSHSTPCVSGGCALVRQYFINHGMAAPSPAMTKAVLMNSARYMNGSGANDTLWSNAQGMGEMNLGEAFKYTTTTPATLRDEVAGDMFTATGQTRVFTGTISDSSKPFRVTLAWTDSPGSTSGVAYKNNLDLTVTIGANTYKGNVFSGAFSTTGGSADNANNVESVFLPAGTSGAYTVTVTAANINSDGVPGTGTATDQDFALVIYNGGNGCSAPTASGNTGSQSICAGSPVTFSITATGTSPTFQWRKNTVNIGGATSSTYTINTVAAGDAGSYDCVVTNACGNVTSTAQTLFVPDVTSITGQPTAQVACAGGSASFGVTAGGGSLSYQWRKDGAAITGETSATLSIDPVAASDMGSYDCVVTGACGNATSNAASLTLAAAPNVTMNPHPATACVGGSATFTITASGAVSYQWYKNGSVVSGATAASLTLSPVSAANGGNYYCVVTGVCAGSTASSNFALLQVFDPVVINTQPTAQSVCAGASVSLSVDAGGSIEGYQWRKNGVDIQGANDTLFTINPAMVTDTAMYDCVISGDCNTATSNAVAVSVGTSPGINGQPQPATACPGGSASFTVAATGASLSYQWRKNTVNIGGATLATYTINPVAAGDMGSYDCVVTGGCGSTTSLAASLTVNTATSISGQPSPQSVCSGGSASFTVMAAGSSLTYQWRKNTANIGGATSATYTINPAASADNGSYDCVVTGTCGTATSNAASLSVGDALSITTQPADQNVCENGTVSLSVGVSGGPASYQWRKNTVNIGSATGATLSINPAAVTDAGSYDCVVTGSCGPITSNAASVNVCTTAGITGQPMGQTACPGSTASFQVTASGSGLAYQWRKNTVNIGGATAASLSISPVTAGSAGDYDCVVSTCCNSATSSVAHLTVCAVDFDCSGTLTVQDIFAYLNAWFMGDPRADFDGNPGLAVQDIFAFLNAWFAGC
jgi:hypothetical protein